MTIGSPPLSIDGGGSVIVPPAATIHSRRLSTLSSTTSTSASTALIVASTAFTSFPPDEEPLIEEPETLSLPPSPLHDSGHRRFSSTSPDKRDFATCFTCDLPELAAFLAEVFDGGIMRESAILRQLSPTEKTRLEKTTISHPIDRTMTFLGIVADSKVPKLQHSFILYLADHLYLKNYVTEEAVEEARAAIDEIATFRDADLWIEENFIDDLTFDGLADTLEEHLTTMLYVTYLKAQIPPQTLSFLRRERFHAPVRVRAFLRIVETSKNTALRTALLQYMSDMTDLRDLLRHPPV